MDLLIDRGIGFGFDKQVVEVLHQVILTLSQADISLLIQPSHLMSMAF